MRIDRAVEPRIIAIPVPARLSFVLIISACSILEGPGEISNPMDPNDPDFVPPQVTFSLAPAAGETVDTSFVKFTWEGNFPGMVFSFRMDTAAWSDWSADQSIEYPLLDEGDHNFQIRSRYPNGVESEIPQEIGFTVDDIHGPALWFSPRLTEVTVGEQFRVEVMAEEVTDLAMLTISLRFDPNIMQVQEITVYEDNTAFLKSNGGTIIAFQEFDNANGTVNIDVGVATGSPTSVNGTGVIAGIDFIAFSEGNTEIRYEGNTEMRNQDNQEIPVQERVTGVVRVE
jgi:hypothetical protein